MGGLPQEELGPARAARQPRARRGGGRGGRLRAALAPVRIQRTGTLPRRDGRVMEMQFSSQDRDVAGVSERTLAKTIWPPLGPSGVTRGRARAPATSPATGEVRETRPTFSEKPATKAAIARKPKQKSVVA